MAESWQKKEVLDLCRIKRVRVRVNNLKMAFALMQEMIQRDSLRRSSLFVDLNCFVFGLVHQPLVPVTIYKFNTQVETRVGTCTFSLSGNAAFSIYFYFACFAHSKETRQFFLINFPLSRTRACRETHSYARSRFSGKNN